jgi:hypothetical protein
MVRWRDLSTRREAIRPFPKNPAAIRVPTLRRERSVRAVLRVLGS